MRFNTVRTAYKSHSCSFEHGASLHALLLTNNCTAVQSLLMDTVETEFHRIFTRRFNSLVQGRAGST